MKIINVTLGSSVSLSYKFSFYVADEFDAYIIVSFVNATLVLSIGDTVEEVTDSGFLGTTPTLCCSSLGDDALVQVSKFWILNVFLLVPFSPRCF